MDYTVIIAALITGVCAVVGQWLISRKNRRELDVKRQLAEQRRIDWQERVEHKLDEHNSYSEKFAAASERFSDIAVELAEIKTEIRNLKESK